MSFRFIGSYYVARTEEANRHEPNRSIRCFVTFLDDTQEAFDVDRKSKGQQVLDSVFDYLEISERDYFGLEYQDEPNVRRWLDPSKPLRKQFKHTHPPYNFHFRVKFYVSDPSRLLEEYTRYHFFLQLKKDLLAGRLVCPYETAVLLASYALQSELGDYSPVHHKDGYVSDFRFIPGQTPAFEHDAAILHQKHRGLTPACAELSCLHTARQLDHYGCFLYRVTDGEKVDVQVGVNASGVAVFRGSLRMHLYSWVNIVKISFKRKQFFLSLRDFAAGDASHGSQQLVFYVTSSRDCKALWHSCVEHHTFFRLHRPPPQGSSVLPSLLLGGAKFRYSGRTEFQTLEDMKRRPRLERSFSRVPSRRYGRRPPGMGPGAPPGHQRSVSNGRIPMEAKEDDGGFLSRSAYPYATMPRVKPTPAVPASKDSFTYSSATVSRPQPLAPAGFQRQASLPPHQRVHSIAPATASYRSNSASIASVQELPVKPPGVQTNGFHADPHLSSANYAESLVTIRIKPDDSGRFGFNVKGGYDQGLPILVSKVAPNMPADVSIPRLNEGDQVLYINGRDMSTHTHEQAVQFIRAAAEKHSGELVLVVRPAMYTSMDDSSGGEGDRTDTTSASGALNGDLSGVVPSSMDEVSPPPAQKASTLEESVALLESSLESNAAVAQFEHLYRRKPELSMEAARQPENVVKNRYRDISPYDSTRVILQDPSITGSDYINASYVDMEIPTGVINRYIAAQGPLPNTSADFWYMCWEQQVTMVVMLTANSERGRTKCHQYWPAHYESAEFAGLAVACVSEVLTDNLAVRELVLTRDGVERRVTHLQYVNWPDHGTPACHTEFRSFVQRVRKHREGRLEPIVVHCSAGIGRTGVLITMETAMCLLEAKLPIHPLDIVREMRDQRAMLIQTPSQFRFVCEAILHCYKNS